MTANSAKFVFAASASGLRAIRGLATFAVQIGVVVVAGLTAHPVHGQTKPTSTPPTALQIEREVARLVAVNPNGALWPGFDPLAIPLAIFDGQKTYLFRHPSPQIGFATAPGSDTKVFVRDGRLPEVTANTSAMIGGVSTATLMLGSTSTLTQMAPIAVHESFHVYQRTHHSNWIANEADLFVYEFKNPEQLAFRRLESDALRRALASTAQNQSKCWTRTALDYRRSRFASMDPNFAEYERGTELNEGLAAYVEGRAARRTLQMRATEFNMMEVRQRAYESGNALAVLLDRFSPQWKRAFDSDSNPSLERALGAAVGATSKCAFTASEIAAANDRALVESKALEGDRAKRLQAFSAKSGWQLVIQASSSEPLFPQGFDPLNVTRLGESQFLHTRFLKTGNSSGQAEFLNVESMTESAGAHPINNGFRRVTLTGLVEPVVSDSAGAVVVKAPGVTAQFKGATVARENMKITISLGAR